MKIAVQVLFDLGVVLILVGLVADRVFPALREGKRLLIFLGAVLIVISVALGVGFGFVAGYQSGKAYRESQGR